MEMNRSIRIGTPRNRPAAQPCRQPEDKDIDLRRITKHDGVRLRLPKEAPEQTRIGRKPPGIAQGTLRPAKLALVFDVIPEVVMDFRDVRARDPKGGEQNAVARLAFVAR